jgi:hypothetical protein
MIMAEVEKVRGENILQIELVRKAVARDCREEFKKELDPLKAQNNELSSKLTDIQN